MKWSARRNWSLGLALGGLIALAGCGERSTPELCDEACMIWDVCEGANDWYPYAQCVTECRAEGDWTNGYVDCLRKYTACTEIEVNCG